MIWSLPSNIERFCAKTWVKFSASGSAQRSFSERSNRLGATRITISRLSRYAGNRTGPTPSEICPEGSEFCRSAASISENNTKILDGLGSGFGRKLLHPASERPISPRTIVTLITRFTFSPASPACPELFPADYCPRSRPTSLWSWQRRRLHEGFL